MAIDKKTAAAELLRRRKSRESLTAFSNAIDIPGAPVNDDDDGWIFKPIETTVAKHHELILSKLQQITDGTLKRLMIFMPPGSAKSTYASVVFPPYYLGKFPNTKIILSSYGSDLARRHGRKARQIVLSPAYQSIFSCGINTATSAADEWALTNGSEYMSGGILSGITGNRANGIIIDDPVKGRAEADSETVQNSTWNAYQDDLLTRLVPGGWQVIIQTRWNENDLSGRILPADWAGESGDILCRDGNVWHVICLQAQCEREDDPLGREIGEYLWPEWFSAEHFAPFKRVTRTWNALYQQIPASETGDYFVRDWFKYYDRLPKHLNIYGASDYAVTEGGGDSTEHGVFGVDPNGDIYVVDWWHGKTSSDVWIEFQLDFIRQYKPILWTGEAGPIAKSVTPFLLQRMKDRRDYCRLEWLPSVHDKPTRARAFQALAASGKVYLPANREFATRLLRQLTRFPAGAEDDAVDTCSLMGRVIDMVWTPDNPDTEDNLDPNEEIGGGVGGYG